MAEYGIPRGSARRAGTDKRQRHGARDSARPIHFDTLAELVGTWGAGYQVQAPTLTDGSEIIRGRMQEYKCHSGLRLHATDALELHDLNTRVDIEPALTVGVFLQGELEMSIDGHWYHLGHADGPAGHMWMVTKPSAFCRKSCKGTRVRKVLLSVPLEWIGSVMQDDAADLPSLHRFVHTHRATFEWQPSKRAIALAEQILNPGTTPGALRTMAAESRAIEIITEAISAFLEVAPTTDAAGHTIVHASKAQRIRDYVLNHMDSDLRLEVIARELGMGIASMQRAFKAAYDTTIVEFIREMRLHRAREAMNNEGISVSEAAYMAGYSSPANFSTAFKKLFGLTPSQART